MRIKVWQEIIMLVLMIVIAGQQEILWIYFVVNGTSRQERKLSGSINMMEDRMRLTF